MDCEAFSALLDNYTNLTKEEIAMLEEHAAVCENCKNDLEFFRIMLNVTASLPQIKPPDDLIDKINGEIDHSKSGFVFSKVYYNVKAHIRQYSTVAACLLVGLIVGLNNSHIKDMLYHEPSNYDDDAALISETDEPADMPDIQTSADESETSSEPVDDIEAPLNGISNETGDMMHTYSPSEIHQIAQTEKPSASSSGYTAERNNNILPTTPANKAQNTPAHTETASSKNESLAQSIDNTSQPSTPAVLKEGDTEQQIESKPDTGLESYKIEQNEYTITEDEYAYSEPEPSPTEAIAVEDYELSGENTEVAYSNEGIYDSLHILQGDINAVFTALNKYAVSYVGPYYRMSLSEFQLFLNDLDMEGIYYSYTCMRGEEADVLFTISK